MGNEAESKMLPTSILNEFHFEKNRNLFELLHVKIVSIDFDVNKFSIRCADS